MKPNFCRFILAFIVGYLPVYVQAVTYICKVDGGIMFTEKRIGNECTESYTDGAGQVSHEEAEQAKPEAVNLRERPGSAAPDVSDIKILPHINSGSVTNTADASNPRMNIKLRNGTQAGDLKSAKARADALNRKAKIIPAPVISAPGQKSKTQLTRKQILQNEIRNEQSALTRMKVQLNVARKKGDQAKVNRLTQAVRDREANILAIQAEMNR